MRTIPFTKMSGSGNDFIVVDNREGIVRPEDVASFSRLVCRRRLSVGADGVVLIEPPAPTGDGAHFRWQYINADGSEGEMCGNGAMCGARFAYLHGIAPADCRFQTMSGLVHARVNPAHSRTDVRIAIVDPGPIRPEVAVEAAGHRLTLHAILVGVPHAVAIVDDADAFPPDGDFLALGRAVRHHPVFAPAGANLDLITIRDRKTLRMRTYERGVEDETLACGTGAVASAIVASSMDLVVPPVAVITSGGRTLTVDFAWDGERASAVTLEGKAHVVARGEIYPEALR